MIFQDLKINRYIILGLTISYIGAFIYSYTKIKENFKIYYKRLDEQKISINDDIEKLQNDKAKENF